MKIIKAVLCVWIFFWLLFMIRGLYKGEFNELKMLLSGDAEARRAYVMGEGLYDFIQYSIKDMPEDGTYRIEGDIEPLSKYRLVYYLYPRRERGGGAYILTFKENIYGLRKR